MSAITHPDKVLFPDDGISEGELAAYYEAVAPHVLRASALAVPDLLAELDLPSRRARA